MRCSSRGESLGGAGGRSGVRDCVRSMYQTAGVRGFYSGLFPTMIRAFPIHSVNFLVYESVMRLLS